MANIELDGVNKKIKVDSGDLTLDVPGDIVLDADGGDVVFADGGTNLLKVTNSSSDVVLQPQVDTKDIVFKQYDGTTVATVEDNATFNIPASKLAIGGTAVTSTAAELNILDGVTATATELNLIDGVTSTTAELNIVDGGTSATSTTLADADRVVVNDNGTMVQVAMSDVKTYIGAANTPSFYAALASDQTINASTYTKLLLATESWDTNSAFASNKFTVPTGEGGKYHIGFSIGTASVMDNVERVIGKLYVNGGAQNHTITHMWAPGDNLDLFINFSTILSLDADEYVELYAYQIDASPQDMLSTYTRMWGFKLIGV